MNLSSSPQKRWVIEGVSEDTVRYAKSIAAEHGLRVADVVNAAIVSAWRFHADGSDMAGEWEILINEP